MEIKLQTKFNLGDQVRIMYDQQIKHTITCPFCKNSPKIHTGIYKKRLTMTGTGPINEIILTCKNCNGKGQIEFHTDDVKRVTQKGIYKVTGFRNIDWRGEAYYELTLLDNEGDTRLHQTTCEHDFRMIPVSEGFINKDLMTGYTYKKPLNDLIRDQI